MPWSFTVENGLAIEGNNGLQMGQEKLLQSTVHYNVQVKQGQSLMMAEVFFSDQEHLAMLVETMFSGQVFIDTNRDEQQAMRVIFATVQSQMQNAFRKFEY